MQKIALLFPGQGSQYVGMGKSLCDNYPIAKEVFEEANEALGFDLRKLCFEGDLNELTKTENTQPAILTASVAAYRVYMKEFGSTPSFVAGHSLGEFSALTCAGSIKFSDCVKIVRQRGRFMQEAVAIGEGAMSAISGVDRSVIEKECQNIASAGQTVVVSNDNAPDQIIISGHKSAVDKLGAVLTEKGARVVPLKVSAPFHSPLMQPAADRLEEELKKYSYDTMNLPVISNVTALPYTDAAEIIANLKAQITHPVRWRESMEYLQKQGITIAVELGPQTVLRNLMKKNAPGFKAFSYDKEEDLKALQKELSSGQKPSSTMNGFVPTVVTKCIAVAVCTKNSNWDNDEYQKGVVEPYRKIQKLQEELEKEGKEPTLEQMKEALEMLRSVFNTKKTPIKEQIERFNQIFDETGTRGFFKDFKMPVE